MLPLFQVPSALWHFLTTTLNLSFRFWIFLCCFTHFCRCLLVIEDFFFHVVRSYWVAYCNKKFSARHLMFHNTYVMFTSGLAYPNELAKCLIAVTSFPRGFMSVSVISWQIWQLCWWTHWNLIVVILNDPNTSNRFWIHFCYVVFLLCWLSLYLKCPSIRFWCQSHQQLFIMLIKSSVLKFIHDTSYHPTSAHLKKPLFKMW